MALNGSLDDYSPAGALRVLSSTGKTGAVRFSGEAGCTVYLHSGQLYFARDEHTDHALATALVRPGRLTAEDWSRSIEEAGEHPQVGELLVHNEAIDADLLASVVLSIVYDPLIRLFREGDGAFDFEPDTVHWIGPFRTFNVDAIVNEVRRRVREVDEMSPVVPSIDSWVTANRTLPGSAVQVTLLREDWELVTALSGPRTIAELAGEMGRGRYSAARVVHRLAEAGLVEVVPEMLGPLATIPAREVTSESTLVEPADAAATEPDADPDAAAVTDNDAQAEVAPRFRANGDQEADDREALEALEGMLDEGWDGGEADPDAGEPFTTASLGDGFDPHPAISDDGGDGEVAWALPRRQPVAVQDDPQPVAAGGRTAPWPESEDLAMDDPAANDRIPGLEGIAGFRNVVAPTDSAPESEVADPALHPNAAWLENLYAQYMDDEEAPGKRRKREMLDVAFAAPEQEAGAKVGTLRRLMDALKKL